VLAKRGHHHGGAQETGGLLNLGKRSLAFAGLAVCAAGLIALARQAPPFREVSDGALLEIYTLEALKGRLLVGPYSRFGWHHPGPLYFYLQAPWYWLSGLHTAGLQAGALAINLSAIALAAWTAVSCGSVPAAVALSASLVWFALRAGDMLVSAWNPHVIVLPLVAFIVVAAGLAVDGRRIRLLWLVAVGSFLVQTHVAMAPIVAVLGVSAIALQWRALGQVGLRAGSLTLALWMPPLVEQVMNRPGNLARLGMFFVSGAEGQRVSTATAAWASALTAASRLEFVVATGREFSPAGAWVIPAAILQLTALVLVASFAKRRDGFATWLALMCAIATSVALVAVTRIHDRIVDHEVFWLSALGALNAGAIAGGLLEGGPDATVLAHGAQWPSRRIALGVCGLAWAVAAVVGLRGMQGVLNRARTVDDHSVDVLTEQIEGYVHTARLGRPLFHIEHPVWPIAAGALLQIDKARMPFAVDDRWAPMFGEAFRATGNEDGEATITGSPLQPLLMTSP
jgi:hypothetical protein